MALRPPPALLGFFLLAALGLLAAQDTGGNRGDANAIQDCCIRVLSNPQPFSLRLEKQLVAYRLQEPRMGCQQEAIVFTTRRGRELCISPDAEWAPALMSKIDAKNQNSGANGQGV